MDVYHPRAMSEPRVLYRSMALGELLDIVRTGKVTGGGNLFNAGDERPYVFFGDELNERLLAQGEATDRSAIYALRDHEIHAPRAIAAKLLRKAAKHIVRQLRRDNVKHDRHVARYLAANGACGAYGTKSLIRSVLVSAHADRRKYARMLQMYLRIFEAKSRLDNEHDFLIRTKLSELARRAVNQPYTSAVIVTRPIAGGLEYRDDFGMTLNGGEPEYGFRPGQVSISDISEVKLVKAGQPVRSIAQSEFHQLESICEAAAKVECAEQTTITWEARSGARATVACYANRDLEWATDGGWLPPQIAFVLGGRRLANICSGGQSRDAPEPRAGREV